MNNYKAHLEYELRDRLEAEQAHQRASARLAERLQNSSDVLSICEEAVRTAREHYERCREDFREHHTNHMKNRQALGEIQDEFFESCEAEEDWH